MDRPTPRPRQADGAPAPLPPDVAVSIVLCVLNEERHVEQAVRHALTQDYAGALELVVALGPSTDRTDEIVTRLAAADPRVRWVRNPDPSGSTPAGLNAAIRATRHPVVLRIDGHALLPREYVRVAVATMDRTGADNVGGIMAAEGTTPFERAVARAMTSRLGVGNASFHTGGEEGPADTVYLGVFRRTALARVGGYDETFLRAQDWEMNLRIRRSGGLVWFQPRLRVSYRPRSTPRALARQYFHYGRWRRVVMRRHEGTVNLRYLAPPVAVLGVAAGALVTVAGLAAGVPLLLAGALLPAGYALLVLGGALVEGRGLPVSALLRLPVALGTMHLAWGVGFLTSPRRLAATGPGHGGLAVAPPVTGPGSGAVTGTAAAPKSGS